MRRDNETSGESRTAERKWRRMYNRNFRKTHREQITAYNKAYYEKHREELRAYKRKYLEENRDRLKVYYKTFFDGNMAKFGPEQAIIGTARRAAGLTQKDLGQALGVSMSMISHFEHGRRQADVPAVLARIAELAHMSVETLMEEAGS